jgi:AcrR family transcriptional regulator
VRVGTDEMREPRRNAENAPGQPAEPSIEARLERAALEVSAEVGYHGLTVQGILERAGLSRGTFYRRYKGKDDCYEIAYASQVDLLVNRLLAACGAEQNWRAGFEVAMRELGSYIAREPLLANGVLVQVFPAGGAAMEKRGQVLERLTAALDRARDEAESGYSPPPIAARFIAAAIEETATAALSRDPKGFSASIPALTYLTAVTFLGADAARRTST